MGRRDAVQATLEVVAECRRLLPRLLVTWEPGWETRGNGTSANYNYGSVHHTATPSNASRPFPTQALLRDGRSDLRGPLCNVATPYCTVTAPRLHVVAAHPGNHAGASRASGPVPALSLFNPRTMGNEIDYAGSTPMSAGQLLVAQVYARATANVLAGGNVEHVRAHAETSVTGKWDPGYASGKTIDMAAFRRTAAALTTPPAPKPVPEDDMTPDQAAKLERIHFELTNQFPSRVAGSKVKDTAVGMILNTDAATFRTEQMVTAQQATIKGLVQTIAALAANGDDVDVDALVARIGERIDTAVSDAAKLVTVKVSVDDAPTA